VNVYLNVKGRKMIERILNWFRTAKPQPSLHDAAVQIGCHYEEVAEMAEAVDEAASMPRPFMDLIKRAIKDMAHSADGFFNGRKKGFKS
jgi:hypothetical protein